jgi:DedD protein
VTTPAEDGFHEIQLTGKQLVFLFMATTVVAVVIFLCGVLVGRGVRAERAVADASGPIESAAGNAQPAVPPAAPAAQSGEPSPATSEDLSYARRLQGEEPKEQLKPGAEASPDSTPDPPTPDEAAPEKPAASPAASSSQGPEATREPGNGNSWVVQVAALRDRGAAVAIIQRLSRKGYKAFIVEPTPGAPAPGFRVRVGPYQDRRQAEQVSRRLEREEQFKPFITR